ncbi:general transcription factor II-I repeat domain-containing protein 2A-like [Scylla paramamosain]|uniref:general transcription factor II-I repeat domain-containing protein 2A-like n=1 Tax=Scylla paramamosain TaxID=85552 RepID=UPI003082A6B2
MEKIMKLANFLRASSSLQHRLLRNFLSEVSASYDDLLLHNNVRWLSKGKVLERFWSIRKEVQEFLRSQQSATKANKFLDFLEDEKEMEKTAFLADITFHLNALNVKLQGKNNTVCDIISSVQAFQKLELFKNDLWGELHHFPRLSQEHTKGKKGHHYTEFIDKLIGNFKDRFGDFSLGSLLLLFIQNPFMVSNVILFSHEAKQAFKWVNVASVQMELIDLHENMILKEESAQYDSVTFWTQKVSHNSFPSLHKVAVHVLTMFGSTYSCESAFSTMNLVKTKYRSRMTNEHFHQCLRLAVTSFVPKFKDIAKNKKCNFSH